MEEWEGFVTEGRRHKRVKKEKEGVKKHWLHNFSVLSFASTTPPVGIYQHFQNYSKTKKGFYKPQPCVREVVYRTTWEDVSFRRQLHKLKYISLPYPGQSSSYILLLEQTESSDNVII